MLYLLHWDGSVNTRDGAARLHPEAHAAPCEGLPFSLAWGRNNTPVIGMKATFYCTYVHYASKKTTRPRPAQQVPHPLAGKRFDELLRDPLRRGVFSDMEMDLQ
jgi:hypothetical protein